MVSLVSREPVLAKYRARLALRPASPRRRGWTWKRPSPWVWTSPGEAGKAATVSPQMEMVYLECQWSPTRGIGRRYPHFLR